MPEFATPNLRQTVAATESVASKIEATLVAKLGMKMSLWHVGQCAKKVRRAMVVAINQTASKKNVP